MDPLLTLSPDIHYLVFQHFDYKDVLEGSAVSKNWNEIISACPVCMSKLRFSMKVWRFSAGTKEAQTEEKICVIKRSTRAYQDVSIVCRFDLNLSQEFWSWIQSLELTVTDLKIKSTKLESPSAISLPHLQVLKLTYVATEVRNILLAACSSLRKLKLKTESPLKWKERINCNPETFTCIKSFLERNQQLDDLELHGSQQYHSFFIHDFSDVIRFHLTRLKIKTSMRLSLLSEEAERNFMKFVATQSRSLQSFFIDGCRPYVLQHVFNKMPALTTIHIDLMFMNEFKVKELNLQLNENIRDLKIPYCNKPQDIREFLAIAPNIDSLFIAHLTHDTVEFIARNMKNLKKLKFRCDEFDAERFYEQLRYDFPEVNQNIEMTVDYEYT